jgi:hypothetical protein
MTGNIFLSFGLANLIILAGVSYVFYLILKECNLKLFSILMAFNFFYCPLLILDNVNDNNLSYFAMLLAEQGSYSIKILSIFLLFLVVLKLEHNKKCDGIIALATIFNLVTSISSGLYVAITILAPCILYYVIKILYDNKVKAASIKGFVFVFLECILSYLAKTISSKCIGFESRDSNLFLTGIVDFWNNLGAVLLGYIHLVGGVTLYSDIPVFRKHGMLQLISIIVMALTMIMVVVSIVQLVRKFKKKEQDILPTLMHCVIIVNLFIFIFSDTLYESTLFECRYFIIVYIMIIIITCSTVQSLSEGKLYKDFVTVALIVALAVQTSGMFYGYYNSKIEYDNMTSLLKEVDALDTPIAYVWGPSFLVTGRDFRPMDTSVIYKIIDNTTNPNAITHWGDYKYYDENSLWQGKTALITTANEYMVLPGYLRDKYKYKTTVGEFQLYEADSNPFDLTLYQKDCKVNFNYMYTDGMVVANGSFDGDGNFVTYGKQGEVMNMTIPEIEAGTYDISLDYQVMSSSSSIMPYVVVTDQDGNQIVAKSLDNSGTSLQLDNVNITSDMTQFTVKCINTDGVVLKLKSIQFEKQ